MNFNPPVPPASPIHIFIIRIWCESAEHGPDGEWRGSIEHAATHEKRYFREVEALLTFIRRQAGWPGGGDDIH
jgi:hypothetical protein